MSITVEQVGIVTTAVAGLGLIIGNPLTFMKKLIPRAACSGCPVVISLTNVV